MVKSCLPIIFDHPMTMYRFIILSIYSICGIIFSVLSAQTTAVKQYIDLYKNIAMREMVTYKVPASITLAQGLLESGSGNSRLAVNGNNHFGIKCKKDWTGCTILEDDDALQECFRCYTSAEDSYKDHSRFLSENKRYAGLFTLSIMDYKGWAAGLLGAGYATNQKYTDLLIGCIERNHLAQYDTLVSNGYDPFTEGQLTANIEIVNTRNIPNTVMQSNQTLESVAAQNNKTEKKLAKYNDLEFHKIEPGDVIYLKPKKRKAGVATHTVQEGDNMWLISQKYAIKLNALYKKNLMVEGTEPKAGTVLQLQHKAETMPDTGRMIKEEKMPAMRSVEVNARQEAGYHIVKSGETMFGIAKLYNLTVDNLKKYNSLTDNALTIGQKLKISQGQKVVSAPSQSKTHSVKSGETLYAISKLYNVSIDEIKKLNNLTSDGLTIGQIIVIP